MTDPFEMLQAMKDRIEKLMQEEEARAEKLRSETVALETRIALASALAALERAAPYVKHAGPRTQVAGAKAMIRKALAA